MNNEYEKQATDFLEKTGTKFEAIYTGHRPHFEGEKVFRACWQVTLTRENRPPMVINFGQSVANSYKWLRQKNIHSRACTDVSPQAFSQCAWFDECISKGKHGETQTGRYFKQGKGPSLYGYIERTIKAPTRYDVMACLTKYDPGTFADFCAEYGYEEDSLKALKTYMAVQKEWSDLQRLFNTEELEHLAEIN